MVGAVRTEMESSRQDTSTNSSWLLVRGLYRISKYSKATYCSYSSPKGRPIVVTAGSRSTTSICVSTACFGSAEWAAFVGRAGESPGRGSPGLSVASCETVGDEETPSGGEVCAGERVVVGASI